MLSNSLTSTPMPALRGIETEGSNHGCEMAGATLVVLFDLFFWVTDLPLQGERPVLGGGSGKSKAKRADCRDAPPSVVLGTRSWRTIASGESQTGARRGRDERARAANGAIPS